MLGVRSFHESFYGTAKPTETGRRGKKRQPKQKEEPENEIAVVGTHYRSFDDDSMAAFVNSPAAQVPWNGDSTLLMDRYDVRHLLQDLSVARRRRRPPSPDTLKEELDYERYRDLEGLENPSPVPEDDVSKNETEPGDLYQRVGFNYSNGGDSWARGERADRNTEDAAFVPPFFVPEHLTSQTPSSLKVHQIMAGTAKFVIGHGGQAEIVLRVKQAANPTFGFLMPDHHQHQYFRFLVDNPQLVGIGSPLVSAVEVLSAEAEGGLSLLGTAYGDSEDEDEEEADLTKELNQEQKGMVDVLSPRDGNDVLKERGEVSERASHDKSPTSDQAKVGGSGNASYETGDADDTIIPSERNGSESKDEVDQGKEVSETGKSGSVTGLEPLPPGTEGTSPMDVEHDGSQDPSDSFEQNLPPFKEPPVQLRKIIDKMVEFISRNGKEFEAIVRERDKKDGRFQFLQPLNEFYPYFSESLETAQQSVAPSGSLADGVTPSEESRGISGTGDQLENDHFLKGVPFWDEFLVLDTSTSVEEAGVPGSEDQQTSISHNGVGGMGFDAVMAAVRAATRGHSRAFEDGAPASSHPKSPEGVEPPEMGSDDAVLAAIRAATGASKRSKFEDPGKEELAQLRGSNGVIAATDHKSVPEEGGQEKGSPHMLRAPVSNSDIKIGSDVDGVVVGKVIAKAAALAAGQEGDSSDAQLTPAEKRKAERLKRAKLFAAMIKDGMGVVGNSVLGSESQGVSAALSVEKFCHGAVSMDVQGKTAVSDKTIVATRLSGDMNVQENALSREQTSDGVVPHVDAEPIGRVEEKLKPKSKEAEEKSRKHRKKRKSYHDDDEKRKVARDHSESEQRRDWRHDHYREERRKDRRRGDDADMTEREGNGHVTDGRKDEGKHRHNPDVSAKVLKEVRKARYSLDSDSKRGSRHGYDAEEWRERRHEHETEKERSSAHRYGSEERTKGTRHRSGDYSKKDSKLDLEHGEKRKDRRHRQASEERKQESQHGKDLGEGKKARKHDHVKRKKRREDHNPDVSEGEELEEEEKRLHRKKRRHRPESTKNAVTSCEEPTGVRKQIDVASKKEEHPAAHLPVEEPCSSTPIDVPDDLRAKVRAMLALMK